MVGPVGVERGDLSQVSVDLSANITFGDAVLEELCERSRQLQIRLRRGIKSQIYDHERAGLPTLRRCGLGCRAGESNVRR